MSTVIDRADRPLSHVQLVRCIQKQSLIRAGENVPSINGMSYNSSRDELFLADDNNKVVRAIHVRDYVDDLQDVYRGTVHDMSPHVLGVCYMNQSDTLLVCSEEKGPDNNYANWLVALSRTGSEWREMQRLPIDGEGWICCALTDSRVLIGQYYSTYIELFRVESGPRIARVHRISVTETYDWFSTKCDSDTLVATTYPFTSQLVRVHRLRDDQLEELARVQLKDPRGIQWLAGRLLVTDWDNTKQAHSVIELDLTGTRLKRRRELIASSDNINVGKMCAVDNALALFDWNSKNLTTHLITD